MHRNLRADSASRTMRRQFGAWLVLLGFSPAVFADCALRAATPEEKQFGDRLAAALLAAMPAAPARMWLPAAPRATVGTLCKDTPAGDLRVTVHATYHFRMAPADEERVMRERRQLEAEMAAIKALPPELKREYDAIDAQAQRAFREARAAEKAGDKALASQKYNESMALGAQRDAVRKRHLDAVKPQFDAVEACWRALPSVRGEFDVVLQANGDENTPRAHELELRLGTLPPPRGARGFKVHGIQAVVGGPTHNVEQRQALIAAFDRARLGALLDGPPPETPPPAAWRVGDAPKAADSSTVATPAATAAQPAAQPAPEPAKPPAAAPSAQPDAAQQAKEAVNKLRGLFGR